jgi:hypothetical protein
VIFAHIAGIPVEETLLSFAPLGAAGFGALVYAVRARLRRGRPSRFRRSRRAGY